MVECLEPEQFYSNWTYELWTKGKWSANLEKVKKGCFNPKICYNSIPMLPLDQTVKNNVTNSDEENEEETENLKLMLEIDSIVEYHCAHQCRFFWYSIFYLCKKVGYFSNHYLLFFADWVFDLPPVFDNCESKNAEECLSNVRINWKIITLMFFIIKEL